MSTVLVHIPRAGGSDSTPPATRFAEPSTDPDDPDLSTVVRRIRGAKRIVVVCGAGVSTAAAIPDFRSAHGLFARGNVKDLFHVKSLSTPSLLPDHHALLSRLSALAGEAQPTGFHAFLKSIDEDGRLLRVYTQNIDGLEERAGLKTGIPPPKVRRRPTADASRSSSQPQPSLQPQPPSRSQSQSLQLPSSQPPSQAQSPAESGATTPATRESSPVRCIPLHGLLSTMHCTLCSGSFPLAERLPLPGEPIACPDCGLAASIRSALSERQRRVGTLRASVVLYGEEHPQGEAIGSVMERDLRGTGPRGEREGRADLLLVAGTSLSIPGVKRMVKEMAKSLASRTEASVRNGREPPVRAVYVNAEPPAKPAEWDGVFDVWAQGDVQDLAALVADTSYAPPLPKTPRRAKKANANGLATPSTGGSSSTQRKRKYDADDTPTKKRGSALPLTPASTPPRKGQRGSSSLPSPSPHWSTSPSPPPKLELKAEASPPQPALVKKEDATPKRARQADSTPTKSKGKRARKSSPPEETPPKVKRAKAERNAEPPSPPAPPGYPAVARFSPPPPFDDLCGLYGKVGGAGRCAVPR